MTQIHPLAAVDPRAELGEGVVVGPFCYVEGGVRIGDGCVLDSHVTIKKGTTIGERNKIGQGTVLGGDPQYRGYDGAPTFLTIGDGNVIREYVTAHRAVKEGNVTTIGNDCYIMAYCHVAHDCHIEDAVTMANQIALAGHVTIERMAVIGGMVGIHQFTRVGKVAMVGAFMKVTRDVPPFMLVHGVEEEEVKDINAVGLRRMGIGADARLALHKACKLLYKSQLGLTNAMRIVREEVPLTPEVMTLLEFEERRFGGRHGRGDQR